MLRNGCEGFLTYAFTDHSSDVWHIVVEFINIFPKDLPGRPLD